MNRLAKELVKIARSLTANEDMDNEEFLRDICHVESTRIKPTKGQPNDFGADHYMSDWMYVDIDNMEAVGLIRSFVVGLDDRINFYLLVHSTPDKNCVQVVKKVFGNDVVEAIGDLESAIICKTEKELLDKFDKIVSAGEEDILGA